ncbi:UNVERIFIED_CONTAM: hypothetical protein RMT77_018788 [Armadillidium vulgare]|nr:Octopamine receptor [Armadillidium vulgare]
MIFVYIRIYYAAKARARRGVSKARKKKKTKKNDISWTKSFLASCCCRRFKSKNEEIKNKIVTKAVEEGGGEAGLTNTTSFTAGLPAENAADEPHHTSKINLSEKTNLINKKVLICDVRVHQEANRERLIGDTVGDSHEERRPLRTLSEQVDADHQNHNLKGENGVYGRNSLRTVHGEHSLAPPTTPTSKEPSGSGTSSASPVGTLHRGTFSHSDDCDQMSDIEPSSSDSGALSRCSVIKPLKLRLCHPLMGKKQLSKPKRELIDMGRVSTPSMLDPEKEKKRIARKKEKRATLILGLIMGSFIACWLPFFFMYILVPLCPYCYIPGYAFDLAFWLGYMNSAFNPVIYTIFNQDFRKAFRKILFK